RPAGVGLGVDEERLAILPGDIAPVVRVAFTVHPFACARVAQDFDRTVFEHAGADALEDMRFCLALDDDAVDGVEMEQMRQEEVGRAGANDSDLSARPVCSLYAA